ncbi:MAG: class I SAM-dependent methyltransferase [Promethearchaeota archaeon]
MYEKNWNSFKIQGIYDNSALSYDIYSKTMWLGLHYYFRNFIIKELSLKKGDVVLEIGCGTGLNFSRILKKIGKEGKLIGLDISKKMLEKARKRIISHRWKNVRLIRDDFSNLENNTTEFLKDININKIIMILVVHIIPNYEDVIIKTLDFLSNKGKIVIGDLKKMKPGKFVPKIYNKIIEASSKKFGQDFGRVPWNFVYILAKKKQLINCRYIEKLNTFYCVSGIKP